MSDLTFWATAPPTARDGHTQPYIFMTTSSKKGLLQIQHTFLHRYD